MYRALLSLVLFVAPAIAAENPVEAVKAKALAPSPLQENLRVLTDEIGGRVPGTPAMQRAVQWGIDAFKAAGADSVQAEPFTMPVSWREGATNLEVISPAKFRVRAVALGWTPATKTPIHARIVDIGQGTE